MLKQLSIGLALLGLTSSVFAGSYKDQVMAPVGVNLVAPDSEGVWSVGLEALYMQPTNADFQYAQTTQVAVGPAPQNNIDYKNKSVSSDFNWGGTIDIAYLFPGNSRDIKIAYTYLHMDNNKGHDSVIGDQNGVIINPFGITFPNDTNTITAKGRSDYDYDSADLLFGQWFRIGSVVDIHPFAGLRWAEIDLDDKGTYFTNITGRYSVGKIKSDFQGIGPRFGTDAVLHVGSSVSFVGQVGASLVIGDIDGKITDQIFESDTLDGTEVFKYEDHMHVIPELDARLGINYTYNFNPGAALGLELGYQVVNYFDVAYKDNVDAITPNTINHSEDFGYHGPYLRMQLSVV